MVTKNKETGCWVGHSHRARYAYRRHKGPIPKGLFVLHRCDNPMCINPDHLFLGTQQDNMDDKVVKGRQAKGSRNGNAKLTEDIISIIRGAHVAGIRNYILARHFKISRKRISWIVHDKIWV